MISSGPTIIVPPGLLLFGYNKTATQDQFSVVEGLSKGFVILLLHPKLRGIDVAFSHSSNVPLHLTLSFKYIL
jgi:hypothetical protein